MSRSSETPQLQKFIKSHMSLLATLVIRNCISEIPPTGMRSLPVMNSSSCFCRSMLKARTVSQKNLWREKGNISKNWLEPLVSFVSVKPWEPEERVQHRPSDLKQELTWSAGPTPCSHRTRSPSWVRRVPIRASHTPSFPLLQAAASVGKVAVQLKKHCVKSRKTPTERLWKFESSLKIAIVKVKFENNMKKKLKTTMMTMT